MAYRRNLGLFTKEERDRWSYYLLTLKDILDEEIWSKENKPKIEQVMNSLGHDQLIVICNKYGLDINSTVSQILSDKKRVMDLYCFWNFVERHVSSIKVYLDLPRLHGMALKKIAFVKILSCNNDDMTAILLYSLWRKYAVFERSYQLAEVTEEQLNLFKRKIRRISTLLSHSVKKYVLYEKPYRLKMQAKFQNKYIYLFMRYKGDEEVLAFSNNKSQSKYTYKFVILDPVLKTFNIVVHSDKERRTILNYISKKIKLKILFDYGDLNVSRDKFSNLFISDPKTIPIIGITYSNSKLPTAAKITIQGNPALNPVNEALAFLNPNVVEANDISNIKRFSILFEGQPVSIAVDKIKDDLNLGYCKLRIPERGLDFEFREKLIRKFSSDFKIPINKFFLFGEGTIDYKVIINFLLNQKHVNLSDKPIVYRRTLDQLYNLGLLEKPKEIPERFCVNPLCDRRYHSTWKRGLCICEKELIIFGSSFSIKIDSGYVTNFIADYLNSKNLKFAKAKRTFNKKKRDVIEIYSPRGNVTIIPVKSAKIEPTLLDYLNDNEINSVLVPYPNTAETQEIRARKHGVIPVSELVYAKLYDPGKDPLLAEINSTIDNAIDRTVNNYEYAIARLEMKSGYNYHLFEKDMYSLIHFMSPIAQRLGDDLIGKRVSDGIVSIPLDEEKRFCITWDCKYTSATYNFREPYKKTVTYLQKLSELPIVKTFGGLRTFVFISNNPSEKRFRKFSKRLIENYEWRGKLVLLRSNQLINLSKHFKSIRYSISSSPELRSRYYGDLATLFYKPGRKIHVIRDDEIANITNETYDAPRIHIIRSDV
jgi:hypothetical protein